MKSKSLMEVKRGLKKEILVSLVSIKLKHQNSNFLLRFIIGIALLFQGFITNAQQYLDLANFEYVISPKNNFDTGSATSPFSEMNGDLNLPIVINENAAFLTGIAYESITSKFNPNRPIETLTGFTLKLGTNIKHNSKLSGTYILLPKISSDLKGFGKKDFQFGGVILMKYEKSKSFNYKFGAYANGELFGPFLVPIFGLYFLNPAEKFELKLLLPLAGNMSYKLGNQSSIGLNFKGQIRSYNINTSYGIENSRYISRSTNEVTTYFQYGLKNGLNFQMGLTRTIARNFRAYFEKVDFALPLTYFGDNRTQLNTDFSDNWMLKLSVFYRLKLNNDNN